MASFFEDLILPERPPEPEHLIRYGGEGGVKLIFNIYELLFMNY